MSRNFTSIHQANDFLLRYAPAEQSGHTYTLERMKILMDRLDNPQNDIPAVHVAGTSGKTSTAYYVRALLQAYGNRTGLTSSPHMHSITERVQVNGVALPDAIFLAYLKEFVATIAPWTDIRPTYFELLTAFAFWTFKKEELDYMIIEVGLGGLLDATNVIQGQDKVSVITPIGMDHTNILGKTVALIAQQKAGIINARSDVFTRQEDEGVLKVLRQRATEVSARLHVVADECEAPANTDMPFFQQQNFMLAHAAASYIAQRDDLILPPMNIIDQVLYATPPGRFEVYSIGDKTIILDGAHNPQKLSALIASLKAMYNGPYAYLIGFISPTEQKINDCLEALINDTDEYIVTQFNIGQDIRGRRSMSADELRQKILQRTPNVIQQPDTELALTQLLQMKQQTLVLTGSLYLVAQLRKKVIQLAEESV